MESRSKWAGLVAAVIVVGLASRSVQTGFALFDKYLGDALYAVMVYGLSRMWMPASRVVVLAGFLMTLIEAFQLTGIPAALYASGPLALRWAARLMGLGFSWLDLLAYAAGIGFVYSLDRGRQKG
jgi:hypothetical protein